MVEGEFHSARRLITVASALAKQPDPTETEAFRSVLRGIGRVLTHQQDAMVALNADELLQIREAVYLDRSKTDQFVRGAYQTIRPGANPKLCPIAALSAWIAIAPAFSRDLFRIPPQQRRRRMPWRDSHIPFSALTCAQTRVDPRFKQRVALFSSHSGTYDSIIHGRSFRVLVVAARPAAAASR